jgi:hypothetical protein
VVDEAVLLDVWLTSGESRFLRSTFLFPKKLSTNFHGCEIRAATVLTSDKVESTAQNPGNSTNITMYDGSEIRLLNLIARALNVTIVLLSQIENFRIIQDESGKYVGYTGLLINDEADITFGAIMRTVTSSVLMDVTKSHLQLLWEWYVPCPVKFPGWKSIFRIFSPSACLSIFLAVMLANMVVVLLATFGFKEYEAFRRVVDAVLDVWALILGVSISPLPRTVPLRMIFSAWVC